MGGSGLLLLSVKQAFQRDCYEFQAHEQIMLANNHQIPTMKTNFSIQRHDIVLTRAESAIEESV